MKFAKHNMFTTGAGLVLAAALAITGATAASAAPNSAPGPASSASVPIEPSASGEAGITSEDIQQLYNSFKEENWPSTVTVDDDLTLETFVVSGIGFSFDITPANASARIGGGFDPALGLYVELSYADQQALLAGGSAALAGALCLVFGPACLAAGAVLAAAFTYLSNNGLCGPGRSLRVYVQQLGYPECQ